MVGGLRSRKLHFFGDNISTDLIIPGKYKFTTTNAEDLAKHAMEGVDPKFSAKAREGDFIIAEENFGCGSIPSSSGALSCTGG